MKIRNSSIHTAILVAVALVCSCGREEVAADTESVEPETREIRSYVDLDELFVELNYTPEAWMAGIREVPRLYISEIPERWSKHTVKEIDVLTKKRLFFRTLGPLVLRSNELILKDRAQLTGFSAGTMTDGQRSWLSELAKNYRVDENAYDGPEAVLEELQLRVDIVPVSLALSQAAEESGWGTSRFAFSGNALFGQWTWGKGISPEQQRSGKGDYKIAAFETPLDSVRAHAQNLNTHNAYADFRRRRAELRRAGGRISGRSLAETLSRYSERGEGYVESLHAIMRVNKLDEADDAFLSDMTPVILVPAGN